MDPGRIARQDVVETVRRPSRGIAPKVVDMLIARGSTSISDIRRLAGRLSGRDVPKLEAYARDLEAVAEGCRRTTVAALRAIRVGIGLGETMDVLDGSRREADRSTHADDLAALESVAALHPDPETFEAWLREVLARPPADGPAVLLSTVHRIKGREWDNVIIFGATAGLFPHRLGNDEEGERRVFHVALTRARTQVVAIADAGAPSAFLAELDGTRIRPARRPPSEAAGSRRAAADVEQRARGRTGGARSAVRLPEVVATIGLAVEDRGNVGEIVELTESAALLLVGAARVAVPFGTDVRLGGERVTLVGPTAGTTPDSCPRPPEKRRCGDGGRRWRVGKGSRRT